MKKVLLEMEAHVPLVILEFVELVQLLLQVVVLLVNLLAKPVRLMEIVKPVMMDSFWMETYVLNVIKVNAVPVLDPQIIVSLHALRIAPSVILLGYVLYANKDTSKILVSVKVNNKLIN